METFAYLGFLVLVLALLALDLGAFHRKAHKISVKEALWLTAFWVAVALLFNVLVYFLYENHWLGIGRRVGHDLEGRDAAILFLTGYLIEKSLSLDNVLVIALVLAHFRIPPEERHRVLYWGVLGAIVMRGIMIAAGVAMIERFDWIIYVFAGLLILSAVKLLLHRQEDVEIEHMLVVRLVRRVFPVSQRTDQHRFFTRMDGRLAVTPLFLALLVVEASDVMFAVDSIPAIFAVTRDPFLVFTSNIFAILGLRALFFALAAVMDKFRYVRFTLVLVLAYVGVKMLLSDVYHIPPLISLGIIALFLIGGVVASLVHPPADHAAPLPEE